MKRDAVLNMRVPVAIKEGLRRAGEDDFGRSASGMATRIFREWLTEHGYLKEEALDAEPAAAPTRKRRK